MRSIDVRTDCSCSKYFIFIFYIILFYIIFYRERDIIFFFVFVFEQLQSVPVSRLATLSENVTLSIASSCPMFPVIWI